MGVQNCNCKDKNERFLDEIIYNGLQMNKKMKRIKK